MQRRIGDLNTRGDFCYCHILYFIPIPQILIWRENIRQDIRSIYFGDTKNFMKWFGMQQEQSRKAQRSFSSFIKTIGFLRFNSNNLSHKYREQFKIFSYQQRDSFHPPYPIFSSTRHNYWLRDIQQDFQLSNPALKLEIYPLGFTIADFSFVLDEQHELREITQLSRNLLRYLKKIKLSVLKALFPTEYAMKIFTQILPESGYSLTITRTLPKNNPPKKIAHFNLRRFHLFQYNDVNYLIKSWKLSPTINKDLLYPFKWVTALTSIYEVFTSKMIEWLQSSDLDSRKYEELWIASAQSLNPTIHYPSFQGRSPLFPRNYQKMLFHKMSNKMQLEKRYDNFIWSLKHQGNTFAPLAHHAIINLERNGRIDKRLKLLTGIRSNIRRCSVSKDIGLTELEDKIIDVLIDQFKNDYNQLLREMNIGTDEMGWMVIRSLGKKMEWSDYKIYESSEFNLKRLVINLHVKGLVKIKTQAKGRNIFVKVNSENEIMKLRLNKVVYSTSVSSQKFFFI